MKSFAKNNIEFQRSVSSLLVSKTRHMELAIDSHSVRDPVAQVVTKCAPHFFRILHVDLTGAQHSADEIKWQVIRKICQEEGVTIGSRITRRLIPTLNRKLAGDNHRYLVLLHSEGQIESIDAHSFSFLVNATCLLISRKQ